MPDVSVVIPTWNRAELLEKAVRSALAQTFPPLEVLVCDDGSTDGSEERIRSIGDSRVRWIAGARSGRPAIPRNRGIRESRGDWLAFLDNDDEWLPDKLERELAAADRLGCRAACCNALRSVPGEGVVGKYLTWERERITFGDILRVNRVICSSALVHRSLFATVLGFPEGEQLKALEDYALWLRVATQTDFAFANEPLLIYRDDPASSIRLQNCNVLSQLQVAYEDFFLWAGDSRVDSRYVRTVRRNYWQICLKRMLTDFCLKCLATIMPRRASAKYPKRGPSSRPGK